MTRKIDIDVYPADVIVTRLYRRFKDWSKRGFGPDDVTWCEVKSDIEEMISAASPAPQEQGVKVKALDWDTVEERWHTASTPFNFGYEVRLTDRDVVRWRYGTRSFEPFDGSFDDAKAACQAHFEARILSALSIQEPASEPVAQLGGAPDDLHNLIKVAFADMSIERIGEVCKEVIARRKTPYVVPTAVLDGGIDGPYNEPAPAPAVPADLVEALRECAEAMDAAAKIGGVHQRHFRSETVREAASAITSLIAERDEARRENARWQGNWDANVQEMSERFRAVNVAKVMAGTNVDLLDRATRAEAALARALEALKPFAFAMENAPSIGKKPHDFVTTGEFRAAASFYQSQRPE